MSLFDDTYKDKRVLITGHTGFKGSWLTAWLLKLGADVCGYSKDVPTEPSLFKSAGFEKRITHYAADVRNVEQFTKVLKTYRPDFVFHMAAQAIIASSYENPLETITTNVLGTANVLDTLRQVDWPCTCVIVTSDKAYENVEWLWGYRETDRLGGKDIYSGSKGAAELIFHAYSHSFFADPTCSVHMATARAGNVIGGGDWAADRIVADCIRAWMQGKTVDVRCPQATRPWQHVLEPLSGYLTLGALMAKNSSLHGESFNFGPRAEQNATVQELMEALATVWGFHDSSQSYRIIDTVPFREAELLKLNCDKALLELHWQPNLSYDECMQMTGSWYRKVVKEKADAFDLTMEHIRMYENLAQERQRVWSDLLEAA